jgi:hypothetical protein
LTNKHAAALTDINSKTPVDALALQHEELAHMTNWQMVVKRHGKWMLFPLSPIDIDPGEERQQQT